MEAHTTDLSAYLDYDLNHTHTPRCLYQIELDFFRMTEMARLWLAENQIAPYKLALLAGVSTSQTHRALHDDWRPSHRLLVRIARALPEDWVAAFERDCDAVLPCSMHNMADSDPTHRLYQARAMAAQCGSFEAYCAYLTERDFTFATVHRGDGPVRFRTVHTADARLQEVARERGYITPFFRPLVRLEQAPDQTNLAILRHPLMIGRESFTSTYWLLQFKAFGTNFSIADRMAFSPAATARQAHIIRRFYDILVPTLIEND